MLIANVSELDELPFLARPHYKWILSKDQHFKEKVRLLQNLRNLSYSSSQIMSKLFNFEIQLKQDTSEIKQFNEQQEAVAYQKLIVTTEKQIISLEKFFYMINDLLPQSDFSFTVSCINKFIEKCKIYIKDIARSKNEIDFGNKEFLTFGIYIQKLNPNSVDFNKLSSKEIIQKFKQNNKLFLKCAIKNLVFEPFHEIVEAQVIKPEAYLIQNCQIVQKILQVYLELSRIHLPLKAASIEKYIKIFDQAFYQVDQEYLKLQVFKNYPQLRSKLNIPIQFNDQITGERLDGPIFSNSDPDCMFSHFVGYNADRIKELEGANCQQCQIYIQSLQQNPILTHLRDNPFNPYKTDVLFCPQYNRFKLIMRNPLPSTDKNFQQKQSQRFLPQIKYLNYLHMRLNLKKIYTKKRNKFAEMLELEKFPLTFELYGRKMLIMDPARGRECFHYQFTDLRSFYSNKIRQNKFSCPICGNLTLDTDILYLKEVEILLEYLKYKCLKFKSLVITGYCTINHKNKKVFLQYKKINKQNQLIQNQIHQIKDLYHTLVDPYIPFNQFALGIPINKKQKKINQNYIFGFDNQNSEKDQDQDQDFQYSEFQI